MNQNIKRLLLLGVFFACIAPLNASVPILITNLGTLKTNLTTLSSSLKNLAKPTEAYSAQSKFNQDALDIYALYGDDPAIIEGRTTVKRDATKNPRLVKANGTLDMRSYTGYGYKTTNLEELRKILKKLTLTTFLQSYKGVTYEVPTFIGISSDKVKKYLNTKKLDIDGKKLTISEAWSQAIAKVSDAEKAKSLADKNLPEKFKAEIKKIEQAIKNIFITQALAATDLDTLFGAPIKPPTLTKFLFDAKTSNLKLMARSTGKEDTPELANAGGNETIGNVNPDIKSVLTALGQGPTDPHTGEEKLGVVSSYFGIKSFTQRIKAGDPTIYEEPPTPVLLQVMIGETAGGEIPACGVLFTEEPEGGIARDLKKDAQTGQFLTTGITRTECSYGLNEGVVNSMVPVDVYYIDRNKTLDSVIRKKDKRVIAIAQGIDIVKNKDEKNTKESSIVNQPALSKAELTALKTLSDYLEFYYRRPMDVEFVVKKKNLTDKSRTIYIVQARPIVNNDKKIQPSYIFDLTQFPEQAPGEVIGSAGGALRLVSNEKECVITDTLKEALEVYDKFPKEKSEKVACIIVKDMAPATSHEATQFRTYQKAVICIPNVNQIKSWLQTGKAVLVDLQQETAVVWNGNKNIDTVITAGIVLKEGWINYPIPMKLSLDDRKDIDHKKVFSKLNIHQIAASFNIFASSSAFDTHESKKAKEDAKAEFKAAITKLLTKPIPMGTTKVPVIAVNKFLQNIKKYFPLLKTGDEKTAKLNLLKICFSTLAVAEYIRGKNVGDVDIEYQVNLILSHLLMQAKNVSKTLNIPTKDKENYSSKRLYTIRFLEAVLFQKPSKDILNNYSLDVLTKQIYIKEKIAEKKLQAVLGKHPVVKAPSLAEKQLLVQYAKAISYAPTPDIKNNWLALLKQVSETSKTSQDAFYNLFRPIAANNLLSQWFLVSFAKTTEEKVIDSKVSAEGIIAELIADYANNKKFIEVLIKKREEFSTLEISLWSNPSKFKQLKGRLEAIGAYFKTDQFFLDYKKAGDLGKVVAIQVLGEFIDLFDHSLKEFKPSTVDKTKDEMCTIVKNEKILLTLFLTFVHVWLDKFEAKKTAASGTVTLEKLSAHIPHALSKYNAASAKLTGITDKEMSTAELKMAVDIPKLLMGTNTFNVGESAIGGTGALTTNLTTLEDIFTFIHQSLVKILGYVNNQIKVKDVSVLMGTLNDEIVDKMPIVNNDAFTLLGVNRAFKKATYTFMSSKDNKFVKHYSHSLREHEMTHYLSFDLATNKVQLTCEMEGTNEYSRYEKIIDYLDVTSAILGLKFDHKFESSHKVIWTWEIDDKTSETSIKRIKNLIVAAAGMSFCVMSYMTSIGGETEIYEATFGAYLGLTADEQKELGLVSGVQQALSNIIIEKSFNKKAYNRLHGAFVTALEKLPPNLTASKNNWLKTIDILGRLLDEKDPSYGINTECFFFKKYHSAAWALGDHPVLIEKFPEFSKLTPTNYVAIAKAHPAKPGSTFSCKTEYDFFKFREAKKILNYLCQMSQYFDEDCWTQLLNVIKDNAGVIAGLKNLVLDPMEGDGSTHPAAANQVYQNISGRILPLETSMVTLYTNAAKHPEAAVQTLGTEAQAAVATAKLAPASAFDNANDAIASGNLDEFLAVCPSISSGLYKDLIIVAKNRLIAILKDTSIANTIIPGQPGQRKKLTDFAAFMLDKNHLTSDEVWAPLDLALTFHQPLAQGKNQPLAQGKNLLCILVLCEAVYKNFSFFRLSIPYILERLSETPTNYSQIALDCYNAVKANISGKKYNKYAIEDLRWVLTSVLVIKPTIKPDKVKELTDLITSNYP